MKGASGVCGVVVGGAGVQANERRSLETGGEAAMPRAGVLCRGLDRGGRRCTRARKKDARTRWMGGGCAGTVAAAAVPAGRGRCVCPRSRASLCPLHISCLSSLVAFKILPLVFGRFTAVCLGID